MHLITIRDQVCNVMASLTKTFVSPDIVLQNLEAITACSSWTKACTATTWSSIVLWTLFVCCRIASRMSTGHPSGTRAGPAPSARGPVPFWNTWGSVLPTAWSPFITVNPKDPKNLADFEDLQSPPVDLLVQGPKLLYSLLTLFFTHLWWPWWSPWCSSPGNS